MNKFMEHAGEKIANQLREAVAKRDKVSEESEAMLDAAIFIETLVRESNAALQRNMANTLNQEVVRQQSAHSSFPNAAAGDHLGGIGSGRRVI